MPNFILTILSYFNLAKNSLHLNKKYLLHKLLINWIILIQCDICAKKQPMWCNFPITFQIYNKYKSTQNINFTFFPGSWNSANLHIMHKRPQKPHSASTFYSNSYDNLTEYISCLWIMMALSLNCIARQCIWCQSADILSDSYWNITRFSEWISTRTCCGSNNFFVFLLYYLKYRFC